MNVRTANEIHVPVGRPVAIDLKSRDVIHSFWVPNLHGKMDAIPGRVTNTWLQADSPGVWRGQCAEFCGLQHAHMALTVVAHPAHEFEQWLSAQREPATQPTEEIALRGQQVFLSGPCMMCHTIRGTPALSAFGPDLTHVASRRTLAAGTIPNTRGHLAGWILDPQVIKPGTRMPPTALGSEDLQALLAYLERLR
jgi:cytochrome c oxidase subunit 2